MDKCTYSIWIYYVSMQLLFNCIRTNYQYWFDWISCSFHFPMLKRSTQTQAYCTEYTMTVDLLLWFYWKISLSWTKEHIEQTWLCLVFRIEQTTYCAHWICSSLFPTTKKIVFDSDSCSMEAIKTIQRALIAIQRIKMGAHYFGASVGTKSNIKTHLDLFIPYHSRLL